VNRVEGVSARFKPGDHLRVWRGLYYHHGIYVGDNRVVQFGGRAYEKSRARIEEVPLAAFEDDGIARVVAHGKHTWPGIYDLPRADEPEAIVRRARWLLEHHPEGAYNLFGRNCESVANWCVAGYGESHQWKRAQGVNALLGAALAFWFSYRVRQGSVSKRDMRIAFLLMAIRAVPLFMYYRHNKRFYDDVRRMKG
jgi:hypothetical protein